MDYADKQMVDEMLCSIDDNRIAEGRPILSVLVRHDDGAVSTAFWTTVKKHNLRLPNEDDATLIKRLAELAFANPE
jgi:hypothetical protein